MDTLANSVRVIAHISVDYHDNNTRPASCFKASPDQI